MGELALTSSFEGWLDFTNWDIRLRLQVYTENERDKILWMNPLHIEIPSITKLN